MHYKICMRGFVEITWEEVISVQDIMIGILLVDHATRCS